MKLAFLCVFFLFIVNPANAQRTQGAGSRQGQADVVVSGQVADQLEGTPLAGAHVALIQSRDTTRVWRAATGPGGEFRITVPRGGYRLRISYLGYHTSDTLIRALEAENNAGRILLSMTDAMLNEVVISGQSVAARQRGDTLEFNAAAFKTNPDASAEDLIRKLPGVMVDPSGVRAQGEEVRRVLVDGQEFFGDDPAVALRNLPAEMIQQIQVFDRMSDQAQLTGFDDGQAEKTINIVTRTDRRNGQFGRVYSGYGDTQRYQAGLATNIFRDKRRISILGMSNNINQQNFSSEDLSGFMSSASRGPGGGMGSGRGMRMVGQGAMPAPGMGSVNRGDFLIGQQSGENTIHSLGINYTDIWNEKVNVNASAFFNHAANDLLRFSDRQLFVSETITQLYNESSLSDSRNSNYRLNSRLEYNISQNNTLIFTPRLSYQKTHSQSFSDALSLQGDTLGKSSTGYQRNWDGYNLSGGLTYRLGFSKRGRSVSAQINTNVNNNQYLYFLDALSQYSQGPIWVQDLVDQRSESSSRTLALSSNITFTEPLSENGMLQLSYNISHSDNQADRLTNSMDIITQSYIIFENDLSSELTNGYLTQRAGLGYRLRGEKYNLNAELGLQQARLSANQSIPYSMQLDQDFRDVLPSAVFTYNFTPTQNLRVMYRTFTNAPSASQLQDVVDNSNPLLVSTGNPDLKQTYSHFFMTRFGSTNTERSTSLFAFLFANVSNDFIAISTFTAETDTVLSNGYELPRGAQISQPVNMNGYGNFRSMLTYGFPLRPLKSNINLSTGLAYMRTPGLINEKTNIANTWNASAGVVLASNISERLDFTLSYNANYNLLENTLRPQLDNNYFYHVTGVRFNWIFLNNWVLRNDLSNLLYRGLGQGFDENYWLWNLNLGRKFLEGKRGELTLGVYDLLDQNKSVTRNITSNYVEDVRSNVLNRFFMLTFTYQIRNFGAR